MKPQALLILLLVAALAVVGYFVSQGGGDLAPVDQPGSSAMALAADAAATPATPESVADQASGAGVPVADRVNRTLVPGATPLAAAASGCVLRGRLVDRVGTPRAGVVVSVDVWPGMAGVIDRQATSGDSRQDVTSGAEGRIEVRVPSRRSGTFSLNDSDLVFAEESRFTATSGEQDLGDLTVLRSARLAGIVQDQDGKPVAGVTVAAELGAMGFGTTSKADTAADGTFSVTKLRPGTWTLTSKSSQFLPTSQKIELEAEQQVTELVIVVQPGLTIAGRVVDDRGVGVADMKVASQRKRMVGGVDIERFTTDEAALTDELGYFKLAGLEGSTATLRATGTGHSSVTVANVKTGSSNVELRVQRLAQIHGLLVAADGTAIVGSRISVQYPTPSNRALEMVEGIADFDIPTSGPEVTTDAEGKFVIPSVKPGTALVKARGKTHLPAEQGGIQVAAAQVVRGIRLIADAGATARIQVVNEAGKPVVFATVTIRPAAKPQTTGFSMRVSTSVDAGPSGVAFGRGPVGSGKTGDDGIATIMGLPGGDVEAEVFHDAYAPSDDNRITLPASGSVDRTITMQAPSVIEVVVSNSDGSVSAGTEVVLETAKQPALHGVQMTVGEFGNGVGAVAKKATDASGVVRFAPIAPGDYRIVLSRGAKSQGVGGMMVMVGEADNIESSAKQVSVGAGETVSVTMQSPILARVTGRVLGSQGPLVGCLVELSPVAEGSISGFGSNQARTSDDGTFTFEGIESGDYQVSFGKPDQIVKAKQELTVPANTPEVHKDLMLLTGSVRVLVLSKEDAEPVVRAEVRLIRGGDSGGSGKQPRQHRIMMVGISSTGTGTDEEVSTMTIDGERVVTDEDGIAVFEDVPVGDYTLKVESNKFSPAEKQSVSVVELQLTDCGTVSLAGAGQIRGMVKDAAGKLKMAMVEHRMVGTEQWSRGEMAMSGSYRLAGLAVGSYEVRARAVGPNAGEPTEPQTVEVRVGKTQVVDFTVQ